MKQNYFTQTLAIEPVGPHFITLVFGGQRLTMPGDDLYLALLAALASGQSETIQVIASSSTALAPLLGQNGAKVGRRRKKIIKN